MSKVVILVHVQRWSDTNMLQINISKNKELVFRRPSVRDFVASQPLPFVEQLAITKRLRVYISTIFSAAAHVEHILGLSVANRRM